MNTSKKSGGESCQSLKPSEQKITYFSQAPKVSIGMPIYNGGESLLYALDSLRDQTFSDYELIITDNVSTDNTPEICRHYAASDPRITYIRNAVALHPMENFNRSLHLARAQYFMWAAHDDVREPQFIATLVKALDENPSAVVAFCGFDNINTEGRCVKRFNSNWGNVFSSSKFRQYIAMTLWDDIRTQKANAPIYGLMRLPVLLACGGMKPVPDIVFCGEDILALLRLLSHGDFYYENEVLFHYRVRTHATRASGESLLKYLGDRALRKTKHHRGSLLLFLSRNRAYHREMRSIILRQAPLSALQKIILCILLLVREFWIPIRTIPLTALHELRPRMKK